MAKHLLVEEMSICLQLKKEQRMIREQKDKKSQICLLYSTLGSLEHI